MKLLFNFATRSRPEKCLAGLDNITQLIKTDNYEIIVTADLDDPTMCNDEIRDKINAYPNTKVYYGISTGKINAINKNISLADEGWQILINYSDDMVFLVKDFDDIICQDMPADLDCFIHYPDGNHNTDILSTMSIVGRTYFERTNYIYHPDYFSVYSDQEETEKARLLGKHKFVNRQIFEHLHPVFKKADWDEQYIATENPEQYAKDRDTYFKRKRINFGI